MRRTERAKAIVELLKKRYPSPESELHWKTPWELLVATMLSAQCTDERVNKVTPPLFERWDGPAAMARAEVPQVEEAVHSTGFFRQKAKNIVASAQLIMGQHQGEVPRTMDELTNLPGVARKTANIVLSNAYGVQAGIAVDTHVKRLAFRTGLTTSTNVAVIEKDLMKLIDQPDWGDFNHMLVLFGRQVCPARKPHCNECELAEICPRHGVKQA